MLCPPRATLTVEKIRTMAPVIYLLSAFSICLRAAFQCTSVCGHGFSGFPTMLGRERERERRLRGKSRHSPLADPLRCFPDTCRFIPRTAHLAPGSGT